MTRLPLEVGVSALKNLARGVLAVPIGLAVMGAVVAVTIWVGDTGDAGGYGIAVGFAVTSLGVYWLGRAWRGRPSDAVLDGVGLTIEGGPHHRERFAWAKLDPARCVVVERFKMRHKKQESEGHALQLAEHGGEPVDVALVDDEGDVASVCELHAAIVARVSGEAGRRPAREARPRATPAARRCAPPTPRSCAACSAASPTCSASTCGPTPRARPRRRPRSRTRCGPASASDGDGAGARSPASRSSRSPCSW